MQIPVKIGKKQHYIIADTNQYMIGEEKIRDGKTSIEGRWFYQSLGALLTSLLHKKVRLSDARTMEELRDAIYLAETEIMAAFNFDKLGDSMAEKITTRNGG
jgi:hypothetical protein